MSDPTSADPQDQSPVEEPARPSSSEAEAPQGEARAESPADPLEEARAESARLRDQLLRTLADFDNYRKRSRREQQDGERRAREDLLRDLLPVFDNLARATQHAEGASDVKSLADGISLVMRQFEDTLQKLGVERIQSVGHGFDPSVHEAIQHLETSDHAPGTVALELQAGYRAGDRVVRPALVAVAKAPTN